MNAELAVNRAIELVDILGAGRVIGSMIDVCNADISEKVVNADVCHINRILNTKLSGESMAELLSGISIPAEVCENKLRIKVLTSARILKTESKPTGILRKKSGGFTATITLSLRSCTAIPSKAGFPAPS